jgi:hypothetical protein
MSSVPSDRRKSSGYDRRRRMSIEGSLGSSAQEYDRRICKRGAMGDDSSMENHNTETMECEECAACIARRDSDEFRNARVDNFYARFHLWAVARDRRAPIAARMEACKRLTHPSYPPETRESAAIACVQLADIAGGIRRSCD